MQIRRSRRRGSSPLERALSRSTACQSTLPVSCQSPDRPYRLTARPNAPLGADLCIFNKFREFPRRAGDLSAGGYSEGGFSAASQTVSSRLFMCEEFAIHLSSPSIFSLPPSRILAIPRFPLPFALRPVPPISHSLFLSIHIRASPPRSFHLRYIFFSAIFEQLTFHRSSSCLSSFSTSLLPSLLLAPPPLTPAPLFLRALYLGAVSIRVWNTGNRTTRVY